jgi:hypothetical protein
MTLVRRPDWPARLARWLLLTERRPWRLGETDCVALLLGALGAMTGADLTGLRYRTRGEARAVLARHGSLGALLRSAGCQPVAMPACGDVAVDESAGRYPVAGVRLARGVLTAHRARGVCLASPAAFARATWYRVPAHG